MAASPPLKHADGKALRKAALAYPDTVEDFPWGPRAFKVRGTKVFLFIGADEAGGFSCSMKLPFRNEEALKVKGAKPTEYGLGRAGWVTFEFSAKAKPPMARLVDWLDESWRAVAPKNLSTAHAPPAVKKAQVTRRP
ncbi:MAG TPA: MmcQ/YjbR family DNA-binding protein [Verrucomicrobiae bacterium]|nr:MmcQ/YjbR family DNA-binding protein [Verrucomicrobiae bacterium]